MYADSAYRSAETEAKLSLRGLRSRIHHRANRNHPLSQAQENANRRKSRVRARIEQCSGLNRTRRVAGSYGRSASCGRRPKSACRPRTCWPGSKVHRISGALLQLGDVRNRREEGGQKTNQRSERNHGSSCLGPCSQVTNRIGSGPFLTGTDNKLNSRASMINRPGPVTRAGHRELWR
jgi:hypothetical protein